MANQTRYLTDYQPPNFDVRTIYLDVDLFDDYAVVQSTLQLERRNEGPLVLHGDNLKLIGIKANDKAMAKKDYRLEGDDLMIDNCPDEVKLTITTRIEPQKNTQLSGLYRSQSIFCTQCEAEGFRRITYYPDRPDVLSTFTTRISADKKRYPNLLSNGNLLDYGDADDGRHWVIWHDPFKKPSYLFALVAGDLACVEDEFITLSGRRVAIKLYVEHGNDDQCQHAMQSIKKAMAWDEKVYGREYDLDIFMVVAVSDFNMGAMENKGLNIFNTKFILGRPDTATDDDYVAIESVVAHEYFHNWTGNRVTCRDWFQLSLKEGLTVFREQEFSRDMNSRDVMRIEDVRVLRATQFPEDAGSMAHPVRPASYEEIDNFYTATVYSKGAEVIRMQHTLLGKETFRQGMDLYFKRHDGQAVTIDDFVAAMADAGQRDLTQFKRWYSQAGTPMIHVETTFDKGELKITLSQHTRPTPECQEKRPFHIPISMALFTSSGDQLPLPSPVIELTEEKQTFTFPGLADKPIISLLRDFSAPVALNWTRSSDELLALLRVEINGYAKWDAAQNLYLEQIIRCLSQPQKRWQVDEGLLSVLNHILMDDSLDPALRACLLTLPSFEEVSNHLSDIDVTLVEQVRDFVRQQVAQALFPQAHDLYNMLWSQEDNQMTNAAFSRRKLRNICLSLMMLADGSTHTADCQKQFKQAKTMTDQMAALVNIVNRGTTQAKAETLDAFYKQWHKQALVMDKWFLVQASCEQPGTLERVKALMSHEKFTLRNPNKVRSLIGAFCQGNPRHFHAADGSGYEFLKEMLLQIDLINPQVASRLATPFTRWQRYDNHRRKMMQTVLKELNQQKLSSDLAELIHKSMEK
ncbi:aminopeptidase N [Legionella sp. W05-934-2]|uniref:aminopeptidase N n=1 Tax=Legionella sp. W05-934-2 TaxID=1198649 RepID=UPI003461995C